MKIIIISILFSILSVNSSYAKTIATNEVEQIYSEAIDARYAGDFAKSRNLLELLKESSFTNEYIMILLLEVYGEYLTELVQTKNQEVLRTAYPGIRENITAIWDIYPDNVTIQDLGLKVAWLMGDTAMGSAMSQIVLEKDKNHLLANYFAAMYRFTEGSYPQSIPYFKKVAKHPSGQGKEQFVFQSRMYLGDIYLEQDDFDGAEKYYQKALEMTTTTELHAKLAIVKVYFMDYQEAYAHFQGVPLIIMTPELFDAYIFTLWALHTKESLKTMDFILSQNAVNPPFAQAMIQARVGRTQKALKILEDATFIKDELKGSYYQFKLFLSQKLGDQKTIYDTSVKLAQYTFENDREDLSLFYLTPFDKSQDINGELLGLLGSIAKKKNQLTEASTYLKESFSKKKDLSIYQSLIDVEMMRKNYEFVKESLEQEEEFLKDQKYWLDMMSAYIYMEQGEFALAEDRVSEMQEAFGKTNPYFNHFLANLYIKQEKNDEAEQLLKDTLRQYPDNIETMNYLAYFYALENKNLDEALILALQVVEDDGDIYFLDTLAWIYYQQNDLENAGAVFEQIEVGLAKNNNLQGLDEVYAHLGAFYKKMENEEKATYYFTEGLKIDPDSTMIKELQK